MKLSRELDYIIRYDVEHDLFHAQNVFNDEYIKPTFIEYVQKLEQENVEMKKGLGCETCQIHLEYMRLNDKINYLEKENAELKRDKEDLIFIRNQKAAHINELKDQLTKTTKLLNEFMRISKASDEDFEHDYSELVGETEQFLEKVK